MLQRVANYRAKDTRANVVVDDSDNPITLTGSAKDEQGADVELSGKLIYEQVEIPGKAVSSGSRKKRTDALEIKDVVAQPKGIRLGQILVAPRALRARTRNQVRRCRQHLERRRSARALLRAVGLSRLQGRSALEGAGREEGAAGAVARGIRTAERARSGARGAGRHNAEGRGGTSAGGWRDGGEQDLRFDQRARRKGICAMVSAMVEPMSLLDLVPQRGVT
jgi:hypothetical protein